MHKMLKYESNLFRIEGLMKLSFGFDFNNNPVLVKIKTKIKNSSSQEFHLKSKLKLSEVKNGMKISRFSVLLL